MISACVFCGGRANKKYLTLKSLVKGKTASFQAFLVSLFGGLGGQTHAPIKNVNMAIRIKASLYFAGKEVSHTEIKVAPTNISENRIKDFAMRSRRYGSNMLRTITNKIHFVNKNHNLYDLFTYQLLEYAIQTRIENE